MNKYRSESHRNQFWDYSAPGAYYITVCTNDRNLIFGQVSNNEMILSDEGLIAEKYFEELPQWHKNIKLDEYVIMPNHFHCIIILDIDKFDNIVDSIHVDTIHELYLHGRQQSNLLFGNYQNIKQPTADQIKNYRKLRRKMVIPLLMGKLKMKISKDINILNDTPGKSNWQIDYYDIIIRHGSDYKRIKKYG